MQPKGTASGEPGLGSYTSRPVSCRDWSLRQTYRQMRQLLNNNLSPTRRKPKGFNCLVTPLELIELCGHGAVRPIWLVKRLCVSHYLFDAALPADHPQKTRHRSVGLSRLALQGSAHLLCPRTMTARLVRGRRRLGVVPEVLDNAMIRFAFAASVF
jgi:hypothetical protein